MQLLRLSTGAAKTRGLRNDQPTKGRLSNARWPLFGGPSLWTPRWAVAAFVAAPFAALSLHVVAVSSFNEDVRRIAISVQMFVVIGVALIFVRRVKAAAMVAVGAGCNFAVVVANGGGMPIELSNPRLVELGFAPQAGQLLDGSKDIPLPREDIVLFSLVDRFDISLPLLGANVYSVGDIILFGGLVAVSLEVLSTLLLNTHWTERKDLIRRRRRRGAASR